MWLNRILQKNRLFQCVYCYLHGDIGLLVHHRQLLQIFMPQIRILSTDLQLSVREQNSYHRKWRLPTKIQIISNAARRRLSLAQIPQHRGAPFWPFGDRWLLRLYQVLHIEAISVKTASSPPWETLIDEIALHNIYSSFIKNWISLSVIIWNQAANLEKQ